MVQVRRRAAGNRASGYDEYVSDPMNPVPYTQKITLNYPRDFMTEDQRFVAGRPDVLVYQTGPLTEDLTVAGDIKPQIIISSSGTDSDFIVKLIDVFPDDYQYPETGEETANGIRKESSLRTIRLRVYSNPVATKCFCAASLSRRASATVLRNPCRCAEHAHESFLCDARCAAHIQEGTPHHGANPKHLVSARRAQPAEVYGELQNGQEFRFSEGHRASLSRRREQLADSSADCEEISG